MQSDDPYLCFTPPPEAPVFTPTEEEFVDPLGYIAKIRPIAEKTGICKVKPPPDWQPPFAVDVDNFKFVPRVQRLNELEAKTRIKLNFLDQLAKFWELQGCTLRIPQVERKFLDLFNLFHAVKDEGGFDHVCKERKWAKVSNKLLYPTGKGVGSILRTHFERVLYPFEMFKSGKTFDPPKAEPKTEEEIDGDDKKDKDYMPHGIASKTAAGGYARKSKSKRFFKEDPEVDYSANSELKKLQFYGAGPKAAVPTPIIKEEKIEKKETAAGIKMKMREKSALPGTYADMWLLPQVDMYMCCTCGRGDGEEYMLLCDGCDDAFHTYCLVPPMPEIPKGDWRCPQCVKKACSKPLDPYGFEQSKKEYTLQSFGEMADLFKSEYFNMPVHMVPCEMVEKEFWRLVNCIEEDVSVQYGADIHASECGSGFPTKKTRELFPDDEEYINSGWNLNNLPVLEQSVLCHINADISGMKVPWCYVGMCFSSFCWHNEDHWSYSINYLHWGEPKTWYGVPGTEALHFEEAMMKMAPELFENTPDLLHQLTTIMNPNMLMSHGVPIVRTNQHAGEFVITFPRSYHAGFNQGYNFAEAVNFCPADWLDIGRGCIEHYRNLQRQCVFSHEELVCKMAADPDSLDLPIAAATHQDMLNMVEAEKKHRKALLDRGTVNAEREAFELLPDDERQCQFCKTTCFLSAVTCTCSPDKLVCIYHVDKLCTCPPSNHCLRYRYTLDELPTMLHRLKVRAESYDNWATNVKNALEAKEEIDKLDLVELKELISEAEEKRFPDGELLHTLINAVSEAEKCANVANQLVTKKVRTRNRQAGEGKYAAKLSLEELNCFYEQVSNLPCVITEARLIKELIDKVTDFQNEALDALHEETPDSEKLEKLIEFGVTLDVDLPEIPKLKQVLLQARWLDEVRHTLSDPQSVTLDVMRKMLDSGVGLAPHPAVEKAMAELQELLTISESWEEKARICVQARPRHVLSTLEAIISEASGIPAFLPNVSSLKEAVRKASEWLSKVDAIQSSDLYPYLDVLENMVNKGRPIPVRLDFLPQLESQVAAAKSWRERTARTFLKKNSTYSLVEVLSPRADIGIYCSSKNRKKKIKDDIKEKKESENNNSYECKTEEFRDPAAMVATFKAAEQREVDVMRELRTTNMEKHQQEGAEALYCVCRKVSAGFMLQCELCKDWFHGTCVPLPKSANMKSKNSQAAAVQAARDLKFMCPLCLRSRRPRLETILSLLVSLQKLPVRLPEGEALQCLTERAMAWQDRARQELATTELASALAKLSMLSQRMVEQAAREKTEKIINAELMKAANNPELQGHLASVTQSAFSGVQNTVTSLIKTESSLSSVDSENSQSMQFPPASPQNSDDALSDTEATLSTTAHSGMSTEHAYSSASKNSIAVSPRKHQRKTPLIPRQMEAPILELSEMARARLEELMMEGDLLEVSLDETQHIWRILQACLPKMEEKLLAELESFSEINLKPKLETELGKVYKEMKEKKKRKKKEVLEGEDILVKKVKAELDADGNPKPKKKKLKPKDGIMKEKKGLEKIKERPKEKVKPKELGSVEKLKRVGDKENKIKKKVKFNPDGTRVIRKPRTIKKERNGMDESMTADEDNEEEDCSAIKCLRPMGDEVNWVQCDQCELWFHLLCVGLGEDEVSEDEEYVCFKCKHGVTPDPIGDIGSQASPIKREKSNLTNIVTNMQSVKSMTPTTPAEDDEEVTGKAMESSDSLPDLVMEMQPEVVQEEVVELEMSIEEETLIAAPHVDAREMLRKMTATDTVNEGTNGVVTSTPEGHVMDKADMQEISQEEVMDTTAATTTTQDSALELPSCSEDRSSLSSSVLPVPLSFSSSSIGRSSSAAASNIDDDSDLPILMKFSRQLAQGGSPVEI